MNGSELPLETALETALENALTLNLVSFDGWQAIVLQRTLFCLFVFLFDSEEAEEEQHLTERTGFPVALHVETGFFVVEGRLAPRAADGHDFFRAERQLGLERLRRHNTKQGRDPIREAVGSSRIHDPIQTMAKCRWRWILNDDHGKRRG